jgi:hypothetical protein
LLERLLGNHRSLAYEPGLLRLEADRTDQPGKTQQACGEQRQGDDDLGKAEPPLAGR